jgi:hypothetical protein
MKHTEQQMSKVSEKLPVRPVKFTPELVLEIFELSGADFDYDITLEKDREILNLFSDKEEVDVEFINGKDYIEVVWDDLVSRVKGEIDIIAELSWAATYFNGGRELDKAFAARFGGLPL